MYITVSLLIFYFLLKNLFSDKIRFGFKLTIMAVAFYELIRWIYHLSFRALALSLPNV